MNDAIFILVLLQTLLRTLLQEIKKKYKAWVAVKQAKGEP